jgi:uncharacterized protein with beta-barrel porin domain
MVTGTLPPSRVGWRWSLAVSVIDRWKLRHCLNLSKSTAKLLNLNAVLALRGKVAWAHDWITDPNLMPTFEALPGASFIVNGATPAKNSALTSAGGELRLVNGVSLLGKFDGEFAAHSQTYAGTGTVRYVW